MMSTQLRSRKGIESESTPIQDVNVVDDCQQGKRDTLFVQMKNARKEFFLVAAFLLAVITVYANESPKPFNWWILFMVFSIPLLLSLAVAVGFGSAQPHQRWIALATACASLGNQLPRFVSVFLVFSGVTLFHLASQPDGSVSTVDNQGRLKAVKAAVLLALLLFVDNFSVWVVAATYEAGIKGTPQPLQDNGKRFLDFLLVEKMALLKRPIVALRSIVNAQWALAASLSVAFGVLDLNMVRNRNLWGAATRATVLLTVLRAIRLVSFLMTVLPSQNPNCFRHRFPPPPDDWVSWIGIGMRPQSNGGCNDLIVSGHATVLTTCACLAASISGHPLFTLSIWCMLTIDFCLEIFEGFHYSVDMWMGALMGSMMWRILASLEKIENQVDTNKKFKPISSVTALDVVAYSTPALAAYVDVIVVSHNFQSIIVFGFVCFVGFQAARTGFTHHLQHVVFCLMFLALAIWL